MPLFASSGLLGSARTPWLLLLRRLLPLRYGHLGRWRLLLLLRAAGLLHGLWACCLRGYQNRGYNQSRLYPHGCSFSFVIMNDFIARQLQETYSMHAARQNLAQSTGRACAGGNVDCSRKPSLSRKRAKREIILLFSAVVKLERMVLPDSIR